MPETEKPLNMFCSFILRLFFKAYTLSPRRYTLKKIWNWIRNKTKHRKFLIPYGAGGKILVDERDYVQREIFLTGAYEPEVWQTFLSYLEPGDVLWDVGANVGSFSIQALLDSRVKRVHMFEPEPENLKALLGNIALNRGNYALHRIGLSNSKTRIKIYRGPKGNCGRASLIENDDATAVSIIDCETADELVFVQAIEPPNMMKLDVEGWELNVLKGASRLLKERPPRLIVFEAVPGEKNEEPQDQELRGLLTGLGYQIKRLKRPSGKIEVRENYAALRRTKQSEKTV